MCRVADQERAAVREPVRDPGRECEALESRARWDLGWRGLAREEQLARWQRVEDELRGVLKATGPALPASDRAQVEEYLDHNELGLAWELLVESLVNYDLKIAPPVRDRLKSAATLMDLDLAPQPMWRRLSGDT